jgi:hypothetical protein
MYPSPKTLPSSDTGSSQVQQTGASASAPVVAHTVASLIAVTSFNPNPQTPNVIKVVKRLRAISSSLEGRSSTVASLRVSAEALRMALDAASSDSPVAGRQQSSVSPLEHSRSDRPARGRVCTLGHISPAPARRGAAAAHDGRDGLAVATAMDATPVVVQGRGRGGDGCARGVFTAFTPSSVFISTAPGGGRGGTYHSLGRSRGLFFAPAPSIGFC